MHPCDRSNWGQLEGDWEGEGGGNITDNPVVHEM